MAAVFAAVAVPASLREMLSHPMPKRSRMKGRMSRGATYMAATAPSVARYHLPDSAHALVNNSRIP